MITIITFVLGFFGIFVMLGGFLTNHIKIITENIFITFID